MNMFVCVIRPLFSSSSKSKEKNFKPKDCEVLLQTRHHSTDQNNLDESLEKKTCIKSLPFTRSADKSQKVKSVVADHLFKITHSSDPPVPGLKVKRVIHAKKQKLQVGGALEDVSIYVVPTLAKLDHLTAHGKFSFYLLSAAISETYAASDYADGTQQILEALDRWLKKQLSRPHAVQGIFRSTALDRIHENITNPAYAAEPNQDWLLLENGLRPDEAMAKMKEANSIDMFVTNPLYGTDLSIYNKIDCYVLNPFYGQKVPDYTKIKIPDREQWFKGQDIVEENRELSWVEEFPVHRAAADGDISALTHFLQSGNSQIETWDHDGWAPSHYACWYGRTEAMKLLLEDGRCDPNLCNRNSASLLHLAAGCGHAAIVKMLCEHTFVDRHVIDKQGRSASECCEQIRSKDWHKCMNLLKELSHRPYQKLLIHRMDGSEKAVELKRGSRTLVGDILESLNFSHEAKCYFALWITSKSLHLQLKPEHSPLVEMNRWPEVLRQLSGIQWKACKEEKPTIVVKRDVRLLPNAEEVVTDIFSIHLLYEEARVQVLRGLYPCSDQVAIAMAAVGMRILFGPHDPKKHKTAFFTDDVLCQLLPICKLRLRSVNWPQKILTEHKEISEEGPGEISQLQLLYLRYCWTQIPPYGSAFFTGYAYATKHQGGENYQRIVPLYIGTNHRGIHFIKVESKTLLVSVSYHSLTWVVNDEKRLFQIRTDDDKINMVIHTPQAALVCSLMTKLSQATT
ncbi:krev interaction trapped protein 1-like isoform X2 [Clavelina lepadiformis]|uniref:krev interaction trapped protein 1-like isoform X2 n=1 Tax=Clavelina lepadiformis TaxID=159417 RepID=UPI0040437807